MSLNFEVHQPNVENLQAYLDENDKKQGGSGPQWWTIPAGMSAVRILPPWDPSGRVALPVYMHPIEFQGEGMQYKKYNWTCLARTFGKQCKICDGLKEMETAGVNVEDYLATRRQFYFNVIVMHDPIYDAGIKAGKKESDIAGVSPGTHVLMKSPKVLYDWVISQITNPMIGNITDIQSGIDIFITKEGTGLGTTYKTTLSPNGRQPIPQEYLQRIESLYDLDAIFGQGFEDQVVENLVNHLRKSAGLMTYSVPPMSQQMAGLPPAGGMPPMTGATPFSVPQAPVAPSVPVAPPVAPPPAAPAVATQTFDDARGHWELINNQWQLTRPAAPAAPPTPPIPPVAPPPPAPPVAPPPVVEPPQSPVAPPAPPQTETPPFNPSTTPEQVPQTPVAPPPPAAPTTPPTPPVGPDPMAVGRPNCYGSYNPSSVQCIVCPMEIDCGKDTK